MIKKNNNDILAKILNKKFQRANLSGYDPEDVDSFFDEIMIYLQHSHNELVEKNKEISRINEINQSLVNDLKKFKGENENLRTIIKEYEQEGYGNKHFYNKTIKTTRNDEQKNN